MSISVQSRAEVAGVDVVEPNQLLSCYLVVVMVAGNFNPKLQSWIFQP